MYVSSSRRIWIRCRAERVDRNNYASSTDSSDAPSTSFLIFGTLTYGVLSLIHLPISQSTLQSPDAVAEAKSGAPPRPFPLFHATRVTLISGGHTPVLVLRPPASPSSFFSLPLMLVDLSCVSCSACSVVVKMTRRLWIDLRKEMFEHTEFSGLATVIELKNLVNEEWLEMNARQRAQPDYELHSTHDCSTSPRRPECVGGRTRTVGRSDSKLRMII